MTEQLGLIGMATAIIAQAMKKPQHPLEVGEAVAHGPTAPYLGDVLDVKNYMLKQGILSIDIKTQNLIVNIPEVIGGFKFNEATSDPGRAITYAHVTEQGVTYHFYSANQAVGLIHQLLIAIAQAEATHE